LAIDDPHELERAVPKLRFSEGISAYKPEHAARMGWSAKLFVRLWKYVPALRKIGRLLRYRF
jgi:O-methyltransferase involved in polyketide biosynthesis